MPESQKRGLSLGAYKRAPCPAGGGNIIPPSSIPLICHFARTPRPSSSRSLSASKNLYESGEVPTSVDKDSAWRAAVDATTAVEVHRIISKSHPKEYLIHHDKIEYFANKKARNLEDYNPNIDDVFILPPAIQAYLQGDFVSTATHASLDWKIQVGKNAVGALARTAYILARANQSRNL